MACKLFSRLDYSVNIKYGEGTFELPAKAFAYFVLDESKLGTLPEGVTKITSDTNTKKGLK